MKAKTLAFSIALATLGFSSLSFAQPARHEARQDAREARQDIRQAQRDLRRADDPREAREARRDLREARRDLEAARAERWEARRYGHARRADFHRGDRLPPELRHRRHVVADWRGHHLAAPPRGHHWVKVGQDYVLATAATGIVVHLVFGS